MPDSFPAGMLSDTGIRKFSKMESTSIPMKKMVPLSIWKGNSILDQ